MNHLRTLPLLALTLASCTSIRGYADFDPDADFSSYRSFTMAAPPTEAPAALPGYSVLTGKKLNREIAAELSARGLMEVQGEEADLIVAFDLEGEQRTEVRSLPGSSMGVSRGWYGVGWYDRDVYTLDYVQGTLIVDVFDRARGELVWHGWSSVSIHSDGGAEARRSDVVRAIFREYPVARTFDPR